VSPISQLEVQGSLASVHSPEHRPGAGGGHDKLSFSARWQDTGATGERYGLIEWARTSELEGFFVFHSLLAEAMLRRGRVEAAYRFERTERPEEERLVDPYRSRRPHIENAILGTFRWTLHTVRAGVELTPKAAEVRVFPFAEVTFGTVRKVGGGFADPAALYGDGAVQHLAAGIVLNWRGRNHRMGRYGVLTPSTGLHH
jgi:hypothetical protein